MPSKNKKNNAEPLKKVKKQSKANKLKQEIKSQKNDLEDQKDRYLRLKAEFDNYRRRKQKEVIDLSLIHISEPTIPERLGVVLIAFL